jgi:phage host-nuclease inhibitor protein Gam
MKSRIKIPEKSISREEVESLVNEIAQSVNNQRKLSAEMDHQILAIREAYGPDIDQCAMEIKTKSLLVQSWAEANPDEFAKRKTVEFPAGKVGFRTGTPKLKTLSGWTFPRALEKLKSLAWGMAFVRVKEELDKEGLIAASNQGTIAASELREAGVKVDQDESFFIEPDLTAFDSRVSA